MRGLTGRKYKNNLGQRTKIIVISPKEVGSTERHCPVK